MLLPENQYFEKLVNPAVLKLVDGAQMQQLLQDRQRHQLHQHSAMSL